MKSMDNKEVCEWCRVALQVLEEPGGQQRYKRDDEMCVQLCEEAHWSQGRAWAIRKSTGDDLL